MDSSAYVKLIPDHRTSSPQQLRAAAVCWGMTEDGRGRVCAYMCVNVYTYVCICIFSRAHILIFDTSMTVLVYILFPHLLSSACHLCVQWGRCLWTWMALHCVDRIRFIYEQLRNPPWNKIVFTETSPKSRSHILNFIMLYFVPEISSNL